MVNVMASDTIKAVKQKIECTSVIHGIHRIFLVGRGHLGDDCTVDESGILDLEHPCVAFRDMPQVQDDEMQVIVLTLARNIFIVHVELSDTIEVVKQKIRDKEGVPPDQQCLVFMKKQLEDKCSLASYGIWQAVLLHLALRLRGGGGGSVCKRLMWRRKPWDLRQRFLSSSTQSKLVRPHPPCSKVPVVNHIDQMLVLAFTPTALHDKFVQSLSAGSRGVSVLAGGGVGATVEREHEVKTFVGGGRAF
ncbi:unnamed protein product [Discosporangium mesarthrocarpum]